MVDICMVFNIITFRVPEKIKLAFENICKKKYLMKSEVLYELLVDYIKENLKCKKNNVVIDEIERKNKQYKLSNTIREENFCNYIIKNAYRTILTQAVYFNINNGDIDMNIIDSTINNYIKLWENFPRRIKANLTVQIRALELLKDREVLYEKLKIFNLVNKDIKKLK